jgi:CRP-like cAMP-binding protein
MTKKPADILFDMMRSYSDLSDAELHAIAAGIPVVTYKKGTLLLQQGSVPTKCYFVIKGCVRQYAITETGRDVTYQFYTENQSIAIFNRHQLDKASRFSLACLEDSTLVVGELAIEEEMYQAFPFLLELTRDMIEADFGAVQDAYAAFIASAPEERYLSLLTDRPDLVERVPQHQLASYLGITPESLSRLKKRLEHPQIRRVK